MDNASEESFLDEQNDDEGEQSDPDEALIIDDLVEKEQGDINNMDFD